MAPVMGAHVCGPPELPGVTDLHRYNKLTETVQSAIPLSGELH